jgi:hypothetical protein
MKKKIRRIYCTSFCNFGHDLDSGRPVGHECYVLPVAALRAEHDGNTDEAIRIIKEYGKGPIVKG